MRYAVAVVDQSNIYIEGPRTFRFNYNVSVYDISIWEVGMNDPDIDGYTREKVDAVIGRGSMWDTECSVIGTYKQPVMNIERFERLKRWLYQWADGKTRFYKISYVYDTPIVRDQIREGIKDGYLQDYIIEMFANPFMNKTFGYCGKIELGMQSFAIDNLKSSFVRTANCTGLRVEMTVSCIFTPHYSDYRKISLTVKLPDAWEDIDNPEDIKDQFAAEFTELINALTDEVVGAMEDMSSEIGTELHCYTTMVDEFPVALEIGPDPGYKATLPWLPGD